MSVPKHGGYDWMPTESVSVDYNPAADTANERLCKGTLTVDLTTLYTVPLDMFTKINSIIICNHTDNLTWFTLKIAGINYSYEHTLTNKNTLLIFNQNIIINDGDKIEGQANIDDAIDYYICGLEVKINE